VRLTLRREDWGVETRDGVRLRVRTVAQSDLGKDAPTVLLVHGIAAPLEPTYDLGVDGYSFLGELASRGLRAIALDHRNFGKSARDPRMSAPPNADPRGLQTLDDSVEDIRAVVDMSLSRYGLPKLTLFGSSRGAIQVLAAALEPTLAARLHLAILNNPSSLCYLSGATSGPRLDAMVAERREAAREHDYTPYTADYQRKRWKKLFGDGAAAHTDAALQEAYIAACIASDADGAKMDPPVFRVPTESFPERVPLLPLDRLAVPTLVIEAEEVPDDHLAAFFASVPRGRARFQRIRDSNHFTLRNARRYELANIIEAAVFGAKSR
jgi:pimeloyl-ACP methyl ester carboxylesterase